MVGVGVTAGFTNDMAWHFVRVVYTSANSKRHGLAVGAKGHALYVARHGDVGESLAPRHVPEQNSTFVAHKKPWLHAVSCGKGLAVKSETSRGFDLFGLRGLLDPVHT